MTNVRTAFAALLLCACTPAAPAGSLFAGAPEEQWRLLEQLREISGLAVTPSGQVLAHDDERAVIYVLDAAHGRIIKSFSLGDPVETGDFEAIAVTPAGDIYLANSRGRLFRFREGADGARVAFDTIDPGLADICEIEGMAYAAADGSLILACKRNHDGDTDVTLYAWPLSGAADARAAVWLSVPEATLAGAARVARFRPSSIEIDAQSGRVLLLSASDGALAELARDGTVLAARALGTRHAQPEGMTVLLDGRLLISDEGGDGQALLSRYARVP